MAIDRRTLMGAGVATLGINLVAKASFARSPGTHRVVSPHGKIEAILTDTDGQIGYSVFADGRQVIDRSRLCIDSDGHAFGLSGRLGRPSMVRINESYDFLGGKSTATNRATLAQFPVDGDAGRYWIDVHVADDGVALRLRLPAKPGRRVAADRSTWRLPGNPQAWATKYNPSYEAPYHATKLAALADDIYGLPLTAQVGGTFVTLSEAALVDYGDLAIKPQDGALVGLLPNDPKGWTTDDEVVQPWRVAILARDLTGLVNTTLIQNLNPPPDPALATADWIKPGKCAWQWMAVGAPQFDDQHQWVDWTAQLEYPYYLVDEGWADWKDPWASLKSVCDYARPKGVGIWLWVHSHEVADPRAREDYFRHAAEIGVVGIKVDFPGAPNRWWATWYRDTARAAAAHRLMIDFHGAVKPTGMERTWPNELSREAVRGHEYQITRYNRVLEPDHDVILPFTRDVIGHADYTPTVFTPKELQGNTWAHELAQPIVFTSPFMCMGGNPEHYLANPACDVMRALPPVWDETRILPGSVPGELAAFARRKGDQWFIGVLNGADGRTLDIALDFLGAGPWHGTRLGDLPGQPAAWDRREEQVDRHSIWQATLAPRGGFIGWIRQGKS